MSSMMSRACLSTSQAWRWLPDSCSSSASRRQTSTARGRTPCAPGGRRVPGSRWPPVPDRSPRAVRTAPVVRRPGRPAPGRTAAVPGARAGAPAGRHGRCRWRAAAGRGRGRWRRRRRAPRRPGPVRRGCAGPRGPCCGPGEPADAVLLGPLRQWPVLGAQAFFQDPVEGVQVDQFGALRDALAQDAQQFGGEGGVALPLRGQGDAVGGRGGQDVGSVHGGLGGEHVPARQGPGGPAAEAAVEDDDLAAGAGGPQRGAQVLVGDGRVPQVLAGVAQREIQVGGVGVPHAVAREVDEEGVRGLLAGPVHRVQDGLGAERIGDDRAVPYRQPPHGGVAQLRGEVHHVGLHRGQLRQMAVGGGADEDGPRARRVRQYRHRLQAPRLAGGADWGSVWCRRAVRRCRGRSPRPARPARSGRPPRHRGGG